MKLPTGAEHIGAGHTWAQRAGRTRRETSAVGGDTTKVLNEETNEGVSRARYGILLLGTWDFECKWSFGMIN